MIVAGFGFRRAATSDSLADALARIPHTPDALATAEDKATTPPFVALARRLGLPVQGVSAEDLTAQKTLTQSDASLAMRATGSVAEAAALAAAGPDARLLGSRMVSADGLATCAMAEREPR